MSPATCVATLNNKQFKHRQCIAENGSLTIDNRAICADPAKLDTLSL